ncbi:hypothetical protein [Buchananella hordeovulneris]|uniref:DUF3459 domain-containing protein n=1 Tax=Buchananella hordeovulneris TaxID=52770 RepID=A0A1Q5PX99_9ACTO|nr:hypothetical protein [Buchananella hordeovulneris]OKL52045.1 hypothetical protein BSZ40_03725 [Buchananella hordeovulneris]
MSNNVAPALPSLQVTTTLIYRSFRGPREWWRDATVYDIYAAQLDDATLDNTFACISAAARLGVSAVSFRPSHLDPRTPADAALARRLVDKAHAHGLKAVVQVSGADTPGPRTAAEGPIPRPIRDKEVEGLELVARAEAFLACGADGIDLGFIVEPELTGQDQEAELLHDVFVALQQLIAARETEVVLGASAASRFPAALARHLERDRVAHLRDDRLLLAPWSPQGVAEAITADIRERAQRSDCLAWRPNSPFPYDHFGPLGADSWFATTADPTQRGRALNLLVLLLPGAVYLRQGDEVGLENTKRPASAHALVDQLAHLLLEQRPDPESAYSRLRAALRLRAERRLGTGALALVEGGQWQTADTLALVNRDVLGVLNFGTSELFVPSQAQVLAASGPVDADTQGIVVPPETTIWLDVADDHDL